MSTLRKEDPAPTDDLAESGQRLYDERLTSLLKPEHEGEFAALDPDSERYFLGQTGLAALHAGRKELPDKLFYLLRVGTRPLTGWADTASPDLIHEQRPHTIRNSALAEAGGRTDGQRVVEIRRADGRPLHPEVDMLRAFSYCCAQVASRYSCVTARVKRI